MKIQLDLADTSFTGTKRQKKEQFCTVCFCWKSKELFEGSSEVCNDCKDDYR